MRIAVVGATGMVGQIILKVLAERSFPVTELIPFRGCRSRCTGFSLVLSRGKHLFGVGA